MKYYYKGQIITASSKEEAIHKIVADTDDWDSSDLGVDAYDKKKSYMYKHNKGDIIEDRSLYSKINNANIKLGKVFEKKLADIIQKHFKGSKIKYVGINKKPRIVLKKGDNIDLEHGWDCIKCDIEKGEERYFVPPEKRTLPNMITVYVNQVFPYSWKSCCTCNVKSQSSINKCLKIIEDELRKYF